MVCLSDIVHIKPKASESYGCAGHCKQTVQGPSDTTHLPCIQGIVEHHSFMYCIAYTGDLVHWAMPCTLASALTGLLHQPLGSPFTPNEGRKAISIRHVSENC